MLSPCDAEPVLATGPVPMSVMLPLAVLIIGKLPASLLSKMPLLDPLVACDAPVI
jgi:hypothetical protein